ncbi:MAG: hypothetical protein EOP00_18090 [Pedobacter sp.]|nr:MAG: hypothetical protein EOP00_18090 [Pedobacter sp.]
MENKNEGKEPKVKNLEWGEHNSRLTAENFVEHNPNRDKNDFLSRVSKPTHLNIEEPGRNRSGVKEGEHKQNKGNIS